MLIHGMICALWQGNAKLAHISCPYIAQQTAIT